MEGNKIKTLVEILLGYFPIMRINAYLTLTKDKWENYHICLATSEKVSLQMDWSKYPCIGLELTKLSLKNMWNNPEKENSKLIPNIYENITLWKNDLNNSQPFGRRVNSLFIDEVVNISPLFLLRKFLKTNWKGHNFSSTKYLDTKSFKILILHCLKPSKRSDVPWERLNFLEKETNFH